MARSVRGSRGRLPAGPVSGSVQRTALWAMGRLVTHLRCVLAAALVLAASAAVPAGAPVLLVLGDSLSTGYGFDVERGWVRLLERRLAERGHEHRVVNASISGETTRGALGRLPELLRAHRPSIVIVELGGNDGLRGISLEVTREQLRAIATKSLGSGARVLLLGMRLPPNYGPVYTQRFHAIYHDVARELGVALVPFFLEGVGDRPELMQADGIHPRARAQPALLDTVWPQLEPLL